MAIDAVVVSPPFVFNPEQRIAFRVLLTAKILELNVVCFIYVAALCSAAVLKNSTRKSFPHDCARVDDPSQEWLLCTSSAIVVVANLFDQK